MADAFDAAVDTAMAAHGVGTASAPDADGAPTGDGYSMSTDRGQAAVDARLAEHGLHVTTTRDDVLDEGARQFQADVEEQLSAREERPAGEPVDLEAGIEEVRANDRLLALNQTMLDERAAQLEAQRDGAYLAALENSGLLLDDAADYADREDLWQAASDLASTIGPTDPRMGQYLQTWAAVDPHGASQWSTAVSQQLAERERGAEAARQITEVAKAQTDAAAVAARNLTAITEGAKQFSAKHPAGAQAAVVEIMQALADQSGGNPLANVQTPEEAAQVLGGLYGGARELQRAEREAKIKAELLYGDRMKAVDPWQSEEDWHAAAQVGNPAKYVNVHNVRPPVTPGETGARIVAEITAPDPFAAEQAKLQDAWREHEREASKAGHWRAGPGGKRYKV